MQRCFPATRLLTPPACSDSSVLTRIEADGPKHKLGARAWGCPAVCGQELTAGSWASLTQHEFCVEQPKEVGVWQTQCGASLVQ